jgi:hypothetical protein
MALLRSPGLPGRYLLSYRDLTDMPLSAWSAALAGLFSMAHKPATKTLAEVKCVTLGLRDIV